MLLLLQAIILGFAAWMLPCFYTYWHYHPYLLQHFNKTFLLYYKVLRMAIDHTQIHRSRSDMSVSIHGKTLKVGKMWLPLLPHKYCV